MRCLPESKRNRLRERPITTKRYMFAFSILAQGGKWDRAEQLIPSLLKDGSYRADLLVPGVLAAWEDHPSLFAKVMDHWQMRADERSMSNYELSTDLCRREVARGTPEKYLASALRWHHVLDGSTAAAIALFADRTERPQSRHCGCADGAFDATDWIVCPGIRPCGANPSCAATRRPLCRTKPSYLAARWLWTPVFWLRRIGSSCSGNTWRIIGLSSGERGASASRPRCCDCDDQTSDDCGHATGWFALC